MSYRNPQIIVDRSAEIWAQGVSKIGETVSAGITNYYEAKKLAKEKNDKIKDANNKLLVGTQLQYDKDVVEKVGRVKSNVFKEQIDKNITVFGDKAMGSNARLKMSGTNLTKEQSKYDRDQVKNYNQYSTNTVSQANAVSEGADSILKEPTSVIISDYEPSHGDDLSSLVAVNVVKGNSIPGVTSEVDIIPTENNSNILKISSKLKVDSDIYRSYKAAGIINEESYPETDGYITISFERNMSEWDGSFFNKVVDAPDSDKALNEGGIRVKGKIDPKFVYSNLTSRTVFDKDGNGTKYREQVLDVNAIENAQAYNSIVKSQAVGLGVYDIKQRQQFITGNLKWGNDVADNYAKATPDNQQNFLENQIKMSNLGLLGKLREVTQEDVDSQVIPGLKLLDENKKPNMIYTIPHSTVSVSKKGGGNTENKENTATDTAKSIVSDFLKNPKDFISEKFETGEDSEYKSVDIRGDDLFIEKNAVLDEDGKEVEEAKTIKYPLTSGDARRFLTNAIRSDLGESENMDNVITQVRKLLKGLTQKDIRSFRGVKKINRSGRANQDFNK